MLSPAELCAWTLGCLGSPPWADPIPVVSAYAEHRAACGGALVWLVDSQHGRQEVRTVLAPPQLGSRSIPVPKNWKIAGVNGQGLVLVGSDTGVGVAVWEPWEIDPPEVLDPAGRFLASSVRRVAWLRDGQLVESGSPYRDERMVLLHDDIVGAAYGPDGVSLALVGKPEGDVTRVRFLESDGSIAHSAP